MTERRKSSRPAVIEKGRQLEEKLRSRETKKELRASKATSKSLDNLTNNKSLNLNQAKDTCSSQSEAGSGASLEWDNSEESITLQNIESPEKSDVSFLNTIDKVIAEINSLDDPFEEGLSEDNQSTVRKNPVRTRNTSTDNSILDLYVPSLDWPPRLPSQEREAILPSSDPT